jgi:hypothetical protein
MSRTNLLMPVLSLLCVATIPAPVLGFRVVPMSVKLDGKEILVGRTGDNGYAGPYTVWRYLKTRPLSPVQGYAVHAEPERPLEAVLRGKLVVNVNYSVDRAVSELKLIRRQENSQEWYVDPDWVERVGPLGDPAEEERKIAAGDEINRKQWEEIKQREDNQRAEEERKSATRQRRIEDETAAYQRNTFFTIGSAAVSLTAFLVALVSLLSARHRRQWFSWACVIAVVFGGLALVWSFTEVPSHVRDERFLDLRYYAVYAATIGSGLALVAWIVGGWRRDPVSRQ